MHLTPVTSKVGNGDPFPNKSHVILQYVGARFYDLLYAFLCHLEPKLLKQKGIQSDVFDPGDLKSRSQ